MTWLPMACIRWVLPRPDAAVQEERVVGVARALRDRQARRVGEAVGRADDEVREGVARVEVGRPALAADPRRLDPDLLAGEADRSGTRRAGASAPAPAATPAATGSASAAVSGVVPMTNSTWTL